MGKLHILLLGTPKIISGNAQLHVRRKVTRLLLYYLACQQEPVSRSELSMLIWENGSDELMRRRLREILSKLRAELPDPSVLVSDHDQVSLDQSKVFVDFLEFQKIFQQTQDVASRINIDTPLPIPVYQKMVQAVDLWRGPRFLTGVTFPESETLDHWLLNISEFLESSRQFMIDRLADHSTAVGDLDAAIRWLRMAITIDPVNESAHYRLISCLTSLGRQNQAEAHCSYLSKIFRQEGITELPPSLVEICREVQTISSKDEDANLPVWHSVPVIQSPFVGQKQLLIKLNQWYQRGGAVILSGEAGSGKTRLVYEFEQGINPLPRTLVAQCRPLENRLPFLPVIDMLRRSIQDDEWKNLDRVWLLHFIRLLPELSISNPDVNVPPQLSSDESRTFLFQAALELLSQLSRSQRLIFFLEDAQWSDEATLSLLAYLVERKFFRTHGLLIIAIRPEEMNPQLESFLNMIRASSDNLEAIRLEPMTNQETGELAQYILGEIIPEELAARLAKETGGNPFFLVETLRALIELSGGVDLAKIQNRFPLAGSIQSQVRARLQLLDPKARQLITTAAVIGEEFSVKLLEAATDQPPEKIAETLDDMEQNRFIQRVSESMAGLEFIFRHSKMREAILLDINPARKRILHLKVAQAIEAIYPEDQSRHDALANHFELAGEIHQAFHHWQGAGLYARQMLSKMHTVEAFNNAEILLRKSSPEFNNDEIHDFYSTWCEIASEEFEDVELLKRIASTMHRLGEQRHSPLLVGAGLNWEAVSDLLAHKGLDGLKTAAKAFPYVVQSNDLFENILNSNVSGLLHLLVNHGTEACEILEKSIQMGEGSTNVRVKRALINARNQLAMVENLRGNPEKAVQHARKALQTSEVLFLPQKALFSYTNLSMSHYHLGRLVDCVELCLAAINKAEIETPSWRWATFNYLILSQAELELGLLDDAWKHNLKAINLNENYLIPDFLAESFCLQGLTMRMLKQSDQEALNFKKGIGSSGGNSYKALECMFNLARTLTENGDRVEADGLNRIVLEQAVAAGFSTLYLPARALNILLHIKENGLAQSLGLLDEILTETRQRSLPLLEALCSYIASEAALMGGDEMKCAEYARMAVTCAKSIPSPSIEMKACGLLLKIDGQFISDEQKSEYRMRVKQLADEIQLHSNSLAYVNWGKN